MNYNRPPKLIGDGRIQGVSEKGTDHSAGSDIFGVHNFPGPAKSGN